MSLESHSASCLNHSASPSLATCSSELSLPLPPSLFSGADLLSSVDLTMSSSCAAASRLLNNFRNTPKLMRSAGMETYNHRLIVIFNL